MTIQHIVSDRPKRKFDGEFFKLTNEAIGLDISDLDIRPWRKD